MNPIGTVISTDKNPSASGFYFVINGHARKGQFVMLDTEEGKMIGRIADNFSIYNSELAIEKIFVTESFDLSLLSS